MPKPSDKYTVQNGVWYKMKKDGRAVPLNPYAAQLCAKQFGWCWPCGRPTHQDVLMGCLRKALTTEDVYEGICIGCNRGRVPDYVYRDWLARNPSNDDDDGEEVFVEQEEEEEPEPVPEQPREIPVEKYEPEPEPEPEPEEEVEYEEEVVYVEEEPEPEPVAEEPEPEVTMNDWRSHWAKRPKGTY